MSAIDNNYNIYWIHHKNHIDPKKEGYIGVTKKEINKRLNEHFKSPNNHLKYAIKKYKNNIEISLIGEFDKDFCLLLEQEYRPIDNIGWNITKGGGIPPSSVGKKLSKETIEKRTKTRKINNKISPLKGKPSWNKGLNNIFKHSEETKKKMKKPKPKGFGNKISEKLKKYIKTEEHIKNISRSLKGRKLSAESIKKRSETYKKKFEQGLYNRGKNRLGKKRGPYKKKELKNVSS